MTDRPPSLTIASESSAGASPSPPPASTSRGASEPLEYALPTRDGAMGRGLRAVLAALGVVAGLMLCSAGRDRYQDGLVLLGFGCIVASIFGYLAAGQPPRRRVPVVWGIQTVLAIGACVVGTFQLMVSLSDGTYELRRGRWDPDFARSLLILGGGIAWFAVARLGARRSLVRAEAVEGGGPPIPSAQAYRRRVWAMAIAIFLVACAVTGYEVISRRIRIWREYQACATYAAPPTQVVFTDDPAESATLLASGQRYDEVMFIGPGFSHFDKRRAQRRAPPLHQALPGWWARCVPFLHARTAGDGETQIVIVALRALKQRQEDAHRVVELQTYAMEPQSWPNPREVSPEFTGTKLPFPLAVDDQLRVFAGQPDPADLSHFTIRYQLNGREGVIDGWLDPGGRVRLIDGGAKP